MGKLLVLQKRIEEGIEFFRKAIAAQPDYAYAHYNLGKAYQKVSQFPQAIFHLLFSLKYEPEDIYAVNLLGRTFLMSGLHENALETYQKVLDTMDANDPFAILGIAETFERMNQPEKALVHYQKAKNSSTAGENEKKRAEERIKALRQGR
jgi:tetratricopeptide (TPR) repeat protein